MDDVVGVIAEHLRADAQNDFKHVALGVYRRQKRIASARSPSPRPDASSAPLIQAWMILSRAACLSSRFTTTSEGLTDANSCQPDKHDGYACKRMNTPKRTAKPSNNSTTTVAQASRSGSELSKTIKR